MIVSRRMAEAASKELLIHALFLSGLELHHVEEAYRSRARETHPDQPGGSAEAFVAVDKARHILKEWLDKGDCDVPRSVFELRRCESCNGTGTRRLQRGFGSMLTQCTRCHGSGDADYDADTGNEGVH